MLQNKLFSKTVENKHIIYRILGIKFSVKNTNFYKQFKDAIKIQDAYDLTELKNTKKKNVFLRNWAFNSRKISIPGLLYGFDWLNVKEFVIYFFIV